MIFKLPVHYNANEWFINIALALHVVLFICLPRKLPVAMTVPIMLFSTMLGQLADKLLGVDYPFDMYDTIDTPKYDLYDFLLYTIVYAIYGYLFAHVYARCRLEQKPVAALLYMLFWVAMSTSAEWLAVAFEVFVYKRWNYAYSALTYFCVFYLQLLFYHLVHRFYSRSAAKPPP